MKLGFDFAILSYDDPEKFNRNKHRLVFYSLSHQRWNLKQKNT